MGAWGWDVPISQAVIEPALRPVIVVVPAMMAVVVMVLATRAVFVPVANIVGMLPITLTVDVRLL